MDLIDICERAKEAGIDVEIRINTNVMEPNVIIEGITHEDDYYDRKRYCVQYSLVTLKEAKVAAEDLIKRATDEIIDNLCPKEITEEMWEKAIRYLYNLIHTYAALGCHGTFRYELDHTLRPLRRRVESGERTRELYDEIRALD